MLLYLDDDSNATILVKLLKKAGHDVQIPIDAGIPGVKDPVHLTHAIRANRVLLTHNHDDFKRLHALIEAAGGKHPGILIVRKDNDKRDLKPPGIVTAMAKFLASGNPIVSQFVILNQYR